MTPQQITGDMTLADFLAMKGAAISYMPDKADYEVWKSGPWYHVDIDGKSGPSFEDVDATLRVLQGAKP